MRGWVPIVIGFLLLLVVGIAAAHTIKSSTTLTIYNPTPFSIGIELKCNWNKKNNKWGTWWFEQLDGNKSIKLNIPKGKCIIWPRLDRK